MNILSLFNEPTAPSSYSAEQYGKDMAEGIIEGLKATQEFPELQSKTECLLNRYKLLGLRLEQMGDIDLFLRFHTDIYLAQSFPQNGIVFRPVIARDWQKLFPSGHKEKDSTIS